MTFEKENRCSICREPHEDHNIDETFFHNGQAWAVRLGPCGAVTTPDCETAKKARK